MQAVTGQAAKPFRVGELEVVTLADGRRTFPLTDDFILNAGRAEINEALADAGMPPDQMTIHFNPVLIRTGSQNILLDTGNGSAAAASGSPAGRGLLTASLAEAGLSPDEIGLVIISHFHADHINGLLTADENPAFPNAEVTVPEREWVFWMNDAERSRVPAGRMQELFENAHRVFAPIGDRTRQHAWGEEVVSGVLAIGTPGHSIGHTSYMVTSANERLFIQSDVTNHPALFATHPGWHARFDQDPIAAEATRRKAYEMLVAEAIPVQGFHFPFPGRGRVEKTGTGYRIEALVEL